MDCSCQGGLGRAVVESMPVGDFEGDALGIVKGEDVGPNEGDNDGVPVGDFEGDALRVVEDVGVGLDEGDSEGVSAAR